MQSNKRDPPSWSRIDKGWEVRFLDCLKKGYLDFA
jgi:hypothetical protein